METVTAKLLRIHGRVQGIGYRESMRREAERLRLSGWVRNRRDGTVEALVCGSAEQVEQIVAWAGQGPRFAMVQRVDVADTAAVATGTFEILFTE
jgi:acylphosphatase